jgi:hypothetical protein
VPTDSLYLLWKGHPTGLAGWLETSSGEFGGQNVNMARDKFSTQQEDVGRRLQRSQSTVLRALVQVERCFGGTSCLRVQGGKLSQIKEQELYLNMPLLAVNAVSSDGPEMAYKWL